MCFLAAFAALWFGFLSPAHATCILPDGDHGDMLYNLDHTVMQYCNGTKWISMDASKNGGSDNLGNHTATKDLDMAGHKITNVAAPTSAADVTTKAYVDSVAAGGSPSSTPNLSAVLGQGNAAGNRKITGLAAPAADTDAATKGYADTKVSKTGDTMTGALNVPLTPTANAHAASKQYVDGGLAGKVSKAGDTMTGALNVPAPVAGTNAATKDYVDAAVASGAGGDSGGGALCYCTRNTTACESGYRDCSAGCVSGGRNIRANSNGCESDNGNYFLTWSQVASGTVARACCR